MFLPDVNNLGEDILRFTKRKTILYSLLSCLTGDIIFLDAHDMKRSFCSTILYTLPLWFHRNSCRIATITDTLLKFTSFHEYDTNTTYSLLELVTLTNMTNAFLQLNKLHDFVNFFQNFTMQSIHEKTQNL